MHHLRSIAHSRFAAALLLLTLHLLRIDAFAEHIGGPMLQQPRADSVLVTWFTTEPYRGAVTLTDSGRTILEPAPTTDHAVKIRGLLPDTRYRYSISKEGQPAAATSTLRTAPRESSLRPVRILAFGDSGSGDANQTGIGALIDRASPDLLVHTGDIVYPDGKFSLYPARFFTPYARALRHVPFLPSVGNHDLQTIEDYQRIFAPPSPAVAQERYYAQRFGLVELIALDCTQPLDEGSAQLAWLKMVLSSSRYKRARWQIVFFHFPMFSAGKHGSTPSLLPLAPLFEAHGVDLVLNGHDHNYARTGAVSLSGKGAPVTYVVTGGGGAPLYARRYNEPLIKKFEERFHALDIRVLPSALTVTAFGADGKKFDSFVLRSRPARRRAREKD